MANWDSHRANVPTGSTIVRVVRALWGAKAIADGANVVIAAAAATRQVIDLIMINVWVGWLVG